MLAADCLHGPPGVPMGAPDQEARMVRQFADALALALAVALAAATSAGAADVSVKLDSGAGFSVKNSTGAIERLRVDESTGNISRNGALFIHTVGVSNVFVGVGTGSTSTGGLFNTAVGAYAFRV